MRAPSIEAPSPLRGFLGWLRGEPRWEAVKRGCATWWAGDFVVRGPLGIVRHRIPGEIVTWTYTRPADVFLDHMPDELQLLHIGSCFQLAAPRGSRVVLHWTRPAYDFTAARDYVEAQLAAAFELGSRNPAQ